MNSISSVVAACGRARRALLTSLATERGAIAGAEASADSHRAQVRGRYARGRRGAATFSTAERLLFIVGLAAAACQCATAAHAAPLQRRQEQPSSSADAVADALDDQTGHGFTVSGRRRPYTPLLSEELHPPFNATVSDVSTLVMGMGNHSSGLEPSAGPMQRVKVRLRLETLLLLLQQRGEERPRELHGLRARCAHRDGDHIWVRHVAYVKDAAVAVAPVPKAGSSTLRALLTAVFGETGVKMLEFYEVPPEALRVVFLRDPIERFISGFQESLRRVFKSNSVAYANTILTARWLHDDVVARHENIRALLEHNNGTTFKMTLERFVMESYDPSDPLDVHLLPQSTIVPAFSDRYDFVGYVESMDQVRRASIACVSWPCLHARASQGAHPR